MAMISPIFFTIAMIAVFALSGCANKLSPVELTPQPESIAVTAENSQTSMSIGAATASQCPNGGSIIRLFKDLNSNGQFESGEVLISATPICNGLAGANGINGSQGAGAGILLSPSTPGSCPTGGTLITTFQDLNNNGAFDPTELLTSTSTVCNGINGTTGTNGTSSIITTSLATQAQCAAGGVVYTTHVDGAVPVANLICNGTNGSNGNHGQSAGLQLGGVGSRINASMTACHHDYLFIPDSQGNGRGWLIFRHQRNGSADQGIGTTGFNLWNVDIADFALFSEVGNVTYCQLRWEPTQKRLTYLVVSKEDGLAGEQGEINFK